MRSSMTTKVTILLAHKQQLLERLQEGPGPNQRDQIERLLAQVDAALKQLEQPISAAASDEA